MYFKFKKTSLPVFHFKYYNLKRLLTTVMYLDTIMNIILMKLFFFQQLKHLQML